MCIRDSPETVLFEAGTVDVWMFKSAKGLLLKKHRRHANLHQVLESFLNSPHEVKAVAYMCEAGRDTPTRKELGAKELEIICKHKGACGNILALQKYVAYSSVATHTISAAVGTRVLTHSSTSEYHLAGLKGLAGALRKDQVRTGNSATRAISEQVMTHLAQRFHGIQQLDARFVRSHERGQPVVYTLCDISIELQRAPSVPDKDVGDKENRGCTGMPGSAEPSTRRVVNPTRPPWLDIRPKSARAPVCTSASGRSPPRRPMTARVHSRRPIPPGRQRPSSSVQRTNFKSRIDPNASPVAAGIASAAVGHWIESSEATHERPKTARVRAKSPAVAARRPRPMTASSRRCETLCAAVPPPTKTGTTCSATPQTGWIGCVSKQPSKQPTRPVSARIYTSKTCRVYVD
eukprot:TRINITY_DN5023_c0_g1_i2.p1 TRINITY_DN5023_c0_g1~~TRINITY_DN5023_c0_g1_i2.p1  ORF type:complete len:405 (+),score=43.83 TRINITY_DN5023_c0_g1_i2:153-1367(+)